MRHLGRRCSGACLILLLALASTSLQLATAAPATPTATTASATPAATTAPATPAATPAATKAPATPAATKAPATPAATPAATKAPATPAATTAPATPAATKAPSTPTATPAATPAAKATPSATPAATPAATKSSTATPSATPATTPASKAASATPAATPKATTTAASAAAALLADANSLVSSPVTTTTPTATTAPVATPVATPAPVASPPPAKSPPPPASPPPPPPINPAATSLSATLQIVGPGIWPFTPQDASAVVTALSQTLTTVTISGINIINATQPATRRRSLLQRMLLAANDTANVQLELAGTTSAAALSINSNLANVVVNGNLQSALIRNNLPTEQLSLISSSATVPTVNSTCSTGTYLGACINAGGSGLSLGVIIAIAASIGAVALAIIGCGVGCVLRRQKQKRRERESQTPATRKGLTPTEARPFFEDKSKPQGGVSMTATSGSMAVIPVMAEGSAPPDAVALDHGIDGETYAEMLEMGGREARDRLHIKLPAFGGKPKTNSNIPGISRSSSTVSHQHSVQLSRAVSRAQSQGVMDRLAEATEPSRNPKKRKDGQQ